MICDDSWLFPCEVMYPKDKYQNVAEEDYISITNPSKTINRDEVTKITEPSRYVFKVSIYLLLLFCFVFLHECGFNSVNIELLNPCLAQLVPSTYQRVISSFYGNFSPY